MTWGRPENVSKLETLGIAKATRTLKVTAVVLSLPQVIAPDRQPKQTIFGRSKPIGKS
jgi:hypothetical protein